MPFHGLAINGTLSTTLQGDITTTYDTTPGADNSFGACVFVTNPGAAGTSRNAAQAAKDTTQGLEWRDYALICGKGRAFNGCPDIELGPNRYIYSDAAGSSWLIRVEPTKNSGQITYEVWLDGIFGRFGINRSFTPSVLDTLIWTPTEPSWAFGSHTAADVVAGIDTDYTTALGASFPGLAFSEDGATCYVHVMCVDVDINEDWYYNTTPDGYRTRYNQSTGVASILKIVISGTGDLDNSGSGISAVITEDLAHEGGIVTAQTIGGDGFSFGKSPCSYISTSDAYAPPDVDYCNNPAATQSTFSATQTRTFTLLDSGDSGNVFSNSHTAILYRTPYGDMIREFEASDDDSYSVTASGSHVFTRTAADKSDPAEFNSVWDGPGTWCVWVGVTDVGAWTGTPIWAQLDWTESSRQYVKITINGTIFVEHEYLKSVSYRSVDNCSAPTGITPVTEETGTITANSSTIDGASTPGTNVYFRQQCRQLGQNLMYIAAYISQPNNEATQDLIEYHIGCDWQGNWSEVWSDTTYSGTYRPISSVQPEIHPYQHITFSYQPKTGDHYHAERYILALFSGDAYQYV